MASDGCFDNDDRSERRPRLVGLPKILTRLVPPGVTASQESRPHFWLLPEQRVMSQRKRRLSISPPELQTDQRTRPVLSMVGCATAPLVWRTSTIDCFKQLG